jgi:hypothetical protein
MPVEMQIMFLESIVISDHPIELRDPSPVDELIDSLRTSPVFVVP